MRVEQNQMLNQQRNLSEQRLNRQIARTRQQKLQSLQPKTEAAKKRNSLLNDQRTNRTQTAQRIEQPKSIRAIQRNQQEQAVKGEYPALQRYYESLGRRTQRAQKDRLTIPKPKPVP